MMICNVVKHSSKNYVAKSANSTEIHSAESFKNTNFTLSSSSVYGIFHRN